MQLIEAETGNIDDIKEKMRSVVNEENHYFIHNIN